MSTRQKLGACCMLCCRCGKKCISPLPFSCAAPKSGERKGSAKEAPKQEAPKGLFNFGGKHDCLNSTLPFVTSCDHDPTNANPLKTQRLTCHVLKPANMQDIKRDMCLAVASLSATVPCRIQDRAGTKARGSQGKRTKPAQAAQPAQPGGPSQACCPQRQPSASATAGGWKPPPVSAQAELRSACDLV